MVDLDKLAEYTKDIKLLYVEDNEEARTSTLILLESFFDHISVAVDGEDGYEKFIEKKDQFDLIITDINMPKLSGIDMMEKIRDTNSAIPMIVFSAYNEEQYIKNSVKLSVAGYLFKPIDIQQFARTLSKVTEFILHSRIKEKFKSINMDR